MAKSTYIGLGSILTVAVVILAMQLWPEREFTPFAGIEEQRQGDDDIVARVGDVDYPRRGLRIASEFRQIHGKTLDPRNVGKPEHDLSQTEAMRLIILPEVDEVIGYYAAKEAGITVTEAELDQYIEEQKQMCRAQDGGGEGCREYISQHGLGMDEYWAMIREDVRRSLYRIRLIEQATEGAKDPNAAARDLYRELRETVPIEWLDIQLEKIYEEALADPAINWLANE